MKNFIRFTLSLLSFALLLTLCAAAADSTTRASNDLTFEIPYGTPEIDGIISDGEYDCQYTMNYKTASAWVGNVGNSRVELHFAWDEQGLYYAGTINDDTPTYRDDSRNWVGIDCIEISINPGEILGGDRAEGIFFSFGAMENGNIVAYRHNYADGLVSDIIIGKATGHTEGSSSYTIEVCLPWSLIQLDEYCTFPTLTDIHIDSTGFVPEGGAKLGLLPCAIDAVNTGAPEPEITAAYKFNGTDFTAKDFVSATLLDKPETPSVTTEEPTEAPTETPTETPTESLTEVPTETPTEAPTEDSSTASDTTAEDTGSLPDDDTDSSGCTGIVSAAILPAALAAVAIIRKKEDERGR